MTSLGDLDEAAVSSGCSARMSLHSFALDIYVACSRTFRKQRRFVGEALDCFGRSVLMPSARSPCSSGRLGVNRKCFFLPGSFGQPTIARFDPHVLSDRAQAGPLLEPPVGPVCDGLTFSEIGHCVRIVTCHYQKIDGFQPGS